MPAYRRDLTRRRARRTTSAALVVATAWALAVVLPGAPGFAALRALRMAATGWSRQPTPNAVGPNGSLTAVSCASPASCIAVGESATSAGTSPLAEAWNGTVWRILHPPVPAGATHAVLKSVSCAAATACMAVGHDTIGSGTELTLAESWNGTSWTVRPTPNQQGKKYNSLTGVSCSSATACIAIGNDNNGANPGSALAASWNGTAWTQRPAGIPPSAVYTLLDGVSCAAAAECTAVGSYLDSGSDDWLTLAETWDGTAWAVRATPNPPGTINDTLDSVSCTSADACTATGGVINRNGVGNALGVTLAEVWNGTAWTIQATPNPDTTMISVLRGVSCRSPDACIAVGYYLPAAVNGRRLVTESWNGSAWAIRPAAGPRDANSLLAGVSCPKASDCIAVGRNKDPFGTELALAQRWNGTGWAISKAPSPPGAFPSILDSVSCASLRACTAVGFYNNNGASSNQTLAERWNGTRWQVQNTPALDRAAHHELASVSCPSVTACVAVGQSFTGEAKPSPLAERWNGKTWAVFPAIPIPPGDGTRLRGVSCSSATACTAVGFYYSTASGSAEPLAERWNGHSWAVQTVPSPSGGTDAGLQAVSCSSATACTAVGTYDVLGSARTLAERWNGSTWTVQPTPAKVDGVLYAVSCASATTCIAAGDGDVFPQGIFPVAEVWQNGKWSVQKTVNPPDSFVKEFYGVSCVSATDCRAVGGFVSASTGVSVPLAEVWNGTAWTMQPVASDPAHNTVLAAVSDRPGAGFTAVGSYANAAHVSSTLAEINP